MPSLLIFPIFFKFWIRMCWGQVLIFKYLWADWISPIFFLSWSKSEEHLGLDSSLNHVSPEQNFENNFWTWWSVMTPWPLTLKNLLAVSIMFSLFSNSHNITYQICTFNPSILGAWDHRLNHDVYALTTEVKITNEGSLYSANFWLGSWKSRKFKMSSLWDTHFSSLKISNKNILENILET